MILNGDSRFLIFRSQSMSPSPRGFFFCCGRLGALGASRLISGEGLSNICSSSLTDHSFSKLFMIFKFLKKSPLAGSGCRSSVARRVFRDVPPANIQFCHADEVLALAVRHKNHQGSIRPDLDERIPKRKVLHRSHAFHMAPYARGHLSGGP